MGIGARRHKVGHLERTRNQDVVIGLITDRVIQTGFPLAGLETKFNRLELDAEFLLGLFQTTIGTIKERLIESVPL